MTRGGEPRMARLQAGADLSRPSGRSFGLDLDFGLLGVIALAIGFRLIGLAVASLMAGGLREAIFSWDGKYYLPIATSGYGPGVPLASAGNWAFFPVWPAVLAVLIRLPVDPTVSVLAWGVVMTAVDVILLTRFVERYVGGREAVFVALVWAAASPNWIYLAAYSEGLFVALELLLLFALTAGRVRTVALLALVVGLARPQGAIWALAAAWWLWRNARSRPGRLALPVVAVSGAVAWQVAVSIATGIPGGWFEIERSPGWEMGFGFLPFTTSIDAIVGLTRGVVDRQLAMLPVVVAVLVAVVGLARRRETLPGRWPTILASIQVLFSAGGIGGIPRYIGSAPMIYLGVTGWIVGRRWREVAVVLGLLLVSVGHAVYNFMPWGSNP
jgi:hypothetical protein